MFCIKCGAKLPSGALFCPECGTKQQSINSKTIEQPKTTVSNKIIYVNKTTSESCKTDCVAGMVISVAGLFFWPFALCPIGLLISVTGIESCKANNEDGLIFGIIGLIVGLIGCIRYA